MRTFAPRVLSVVMTVGPAILYAAHKAPLRLAALESGQPDVRALNTGAARIAIFGFAEKPQNRLISALSQEALNSLLRY